MEEILEYTPNKTESVQYLGSFNVSALLQKVLALPEHAWDREDDYKANYNKTKALHLAQHIIFKFADKRSKPYQYSNLDKWDKWKGDLLPLMEEIVSYYGYKNGYYPRVMLAKLPPKAIIPPHVDGIPPKVGGHKIHLVLYTNPDCYFYIVPKQFHLKAGSAYEINNAATHAAINNGNTNRIHLIFEYLNIDIQSNRDYFLQT